MMEIMPFFRKQTHLFDHVLSRSYASRSGKPVPRISFATSRFEGYSVLFGGLVKHVHPFCLAPFSRIPGVEIWQKRRTYGKRFGTHIFSTHKLINLLDISSHDTLSSISVLPDMYTHPLDEFAILPKHLHNLSRIVQETSERCLSIAKCCKELHSIRSEIGKDIDFGDDSGGQASQSQMQRPGVGDRH